MHAAVNASHHILALQGARLFMCFVPLFKRPPVASYYPKKKGNNEGEEKNSTHGVDSVDASEWATHTVGRLGYNPAFYRLRSRVQAV